MITETESKFQLMFLKSRSSLAHKEYRSQILNRPLQKVLKWKIIRFFQGIINWTKNFWLNNYLYISASRTEEILWLSCVSLRILFYAFLIICYNRSPWFKHKRANTIFSLWIKLIQLTSKIKKGRLLNYVFTEIYLLDTLQRCRDGTLESFLI